ncbi:hypothetical protein GCM10012275_53380 [Longimycelium tulufanense]|uniref:Uncharacterized protein n=1 Tax=Longimycelium tulufanense TaxID=907463 RepID=A0A8J3FYY9_9PSEU|nr:hypothetical protein [Longimycelium tulufanense]GGM75998.1 hypothetical protein GCM10012275_53380 [Longimycelium tulufanense]
MADKTTPSCPLGDTRCATMDGRRLHGDCQLQPGSPIARAIDVASQYYGQQPTADERDEIVSGLAALVEAGIITIKEAGCG